LTRVANGRPIQVIYGPAADVPVCIGEEAVERILVNLVRNASQALDRVPHRSPEERSPEETDRPIGSDLVLRSHPPPASPPDHRPAIRITVGPLLDRLGAPRSWPFRHVRLIVQDFGCGMDPSQLHSMLSGPAAASRGTHGIGFRVVRELVASSNGDLRAASTPGAGTQVQIEWPVAATFPAENRAALSERDHAAGSTLASRAAAAPYRSVPPVSHAPQASQANTGAY
jgi:signal transduction histidine kinase